MQSSNPVLNRSSAFAPGHGQAYPGAAPYGQQPGSYGYGGPGVPPQQYQGAPAASRPMTMDDVIVRTAATLGVVVLVAAISWFTIPVSAVTPAFLAGALVAFALAMVLSFSRRVNPVLVMLYAAAEGVFLGIGSKFIANWVGHHCCDNRYRPCSLLGREGWWRTPRDNDVDFELNKLGRKVGQPFDDRVRVSALDGYVLALNITKLVQPTVEWFENRCRRRSAWH